VAPFKIKLAGKTMVVPAGDSDIGRNLECWLTLDDELTSRVHARLYVSDTRVEVEDLGSRNGTFLNDRRLERRQIVRRGDRIRIGREIIEVLGASEAPSETEEDNLKRTLAPGEDTRFPNLMGQLVEKSLKVGKVKEAERYAQALHNQLMAASVAGDHPAARSCVDCLLAVAEKTSSGLWVDRVFRLHVKHGWLMSTEVLDHLRTVLDRIPRVPGSGMREYERKLRQLSAEGTNVPRGLTAKIAELVDAYAET
jgi:hypothetical protein